MKTRTAGRIAWGCIAVFFSMAIVGTILVTRNRSAANVAENMAMAVIFMGMALVGAVVVSRRPDNPIGWILLVCASGVGLAFASGEYAYYGAVTNPGSLPGVEWANWLASWMWFVTFAPLFTFLLLLFPDGHLPSRRWRPVAWFVGTILAFGVVLLPFAPDLDSELALRNPVALEAIQGAVDVLGIVAWPGLVASIVASAASLFVRFRRARAMSESRSSGWPSAPWSWPAGSWPSCCSASSISAGSRSRSSGPWSRS